MIEIECEVLGGNAQNLWIKFNKQKMSNKLNNQPAKGLMEVAFGNKSCDKTNQPINHTDNHHLRYPLTK